MAGSASIRTRIPAWGWQATGLLLWLMLGWVGQSLVAWSWRAAQVDEFEHTVQAVAQLATEQHWQRPWESDPNWRRLEEQLNVDLVPLAEGQSQSVTWVLAPGGLWRASVTLPLDGKVPGAAFLRGTRVFHDHGVHRAWWLTWSLLNAMLWSIVWLVHRRQRQQLALERESLSLWKTSEPLQEDAIDGRSPDQRLHAVLEGLQEGVMCLDAELRIELINSNLCHQLELGEAGNLIGRRLLEVVRVPAIVEMVDHCLATKCAAQQTIEVSSASRYLHVLIVPLSSEDQQSRLLLTATDVSSAQRSELARREFVTGASHELKTPLAAIRAYTETLQSIGQEDPQTSERFLERILDQADRMDRLVSGMLQLARAESGNLKLKLQPIDAALAIHACIEAAAGMAHAKGLRFESHLPANRTMVMADRDALQTIASNLLSNAVRYTPPGGRIELDLFEESTENGKVVCLRVNDTGIGIAQADQQRIFERFYRVQKDRAVESGGTGLGLAIVKQLTQVLNGQVVVNSQPGEGTRFEIRLPAVGFTQSSSNAGGQVAVSER